ncbi:MAG: tetratricopeptide repeat protein [bacterium]
MKCPKCQSNVREKAKFCSNCGATVESGQHSAAPQCHQCGNALKSDAKFCQKCGAAQSADSMHRAASNDDFHIGEDRPRRDMKYILLPLIFVPVLVGIFYLLSFRSQNPESQSADMPGNAQADMSQMMPVFNTIDSLRAVLQENPTDTTALLVMGEMFDIAGKFADARSYYSKYLEINNGRRDVKLRVLGTLINEHKHEEEEMLLNEIVQNQPNDPHIYMHIGDLYERAGKLDKARDYFNKSLEKVPEQTDIYMRFAGLDFKTKDYAAAKEMLEKVLETQPGNPHALYNIALALHLQGDHDKAIEYWQKTVEVDANGDVGKLARQALATYESMRESK